MSNVDTVDAIIFLQVHGEASLSQFTLECLGAGKQKAASHKMRLAVLTSTFLPEILWARKRDWAERARIPLSFKTSPQGTHTSFFPTFAEQYFIRIYLCLSPESSACNQIFVSLCSSKSPDILFLSDLFLKLNTRSSAIFSIGIRKWEIQSNPELADMVSEMGIYN